MKRRKAVENGFSEEEQSRVRGNRIVDLNWLAKMLEAGCEFCGKMQDIGKVLSLFLKLIATGATN